MNNYSKPFLSLDDQIEKLTMNGLQIADKSRARKALMEIGYYRLSGYWFPYRQWDEPREIKLKNGKKLENRKSDFVANADFDHVLAIYKFDDALRRIIFEAITLVEVSLRSRIGHSLGRNDPFAHRDPRAVDSGFSKFKRSASEALLHSDWLDSGHAAWTTDLNKEERRSRELFAEHLRDKYGPPLPIWAATETMTFGVLASLFSGLKRSDQSRIAASYGIIDENRLGDGSTMSGWLSHLRYVRNTCAHHARLWNRNMDDQIGPPSSGMPELAHLNKDVPRSRIYATIAILAYLLEENCSRIFVALGNYPVLRRPNF